MPTDHTPASSRSLLRPFVLAALAAGWGVAAPAWADGGNPYWIGVYQQVQHDTNILRAPEGSEQADWIFDTGLRLGLDQPMGRDRLHGTLGLDRNTYRYQDILSHNSYRGDLGFDWSAPERWSGELGADAAQQLFLYDLSSGQRATEQTLQRDRHVFARARVGGVTQWTFEGELDASARDYSTSQFQVRNIDRHFVGLGARFQPNPDLRLGLSGRVGGGKYPKLGTGDSFDRQELRFSSTWQASGASAFDGYLSWSKENHDLQTMRSTQYWLGSASWRWQPTGKLGLTARLSRDNDAGATETGSVTADARVSTNVELSARWLPTAKIETTATLRQSQRQLDSTFALLPSDPFQAKDRTRSLSLGLVYRPIYSVELGCNASRERRAVLGEANGLTYAYAATVLGCSGQYLWR